MKKILLLAGIIHAFYALRAQNVPPFIGARANGLANSTACVADAWAIFNNPAGLAKTKDVVAVFTQILHPRLPAFNATAAAVAIPFKAGVTAIGLYRTGDDLYSEQILAAGYANTLGLASLGAKIHVVQYRAEGFGSAHKVTLSLGGIAQLTPAFSIGAHILNINQPGFSKSDERLPTVMTLGIAYKFSSYVWATTEIQKDLDYAPTWKTGLEYEAHKKVIFRTGFSLKPNTASFGVGFRPGKLGIDYAIAHNPAMGSQHQASVRYTLSAARK